MEKKHEKSSIGIVQKTKNLMLSGIALSAVTGLAGAVADGSKDYKIWIKIPDIDNLFTVKTNWKLKVGDSVKIHYNSKNFKKCEIDDDYLWNKNLSDTIRNKSKKD